MDREEVLEIILQVMDDLDEREKFVLLERYKSDKPTYRSKIAPLVPRRDGSGKTGVTIDRVRQIENIAISKIKHRIYLSEHAPR